MKRKSIYELMPGLLVLIIFVLACGSSGNSISNISSRSVEEQIVFLDTDKIPQPSDSNVREVAALLDFLAANTTSSRKEIGDFTTGTVDVIKKRYNKDYKHLDILKGVKRIIEAIPPEKRGKKEDFKTYSSLLIIEASTK